MMSGVPSSNHTSTPAARKSAANSGRATTTGSRSARPARATRRSRRVTPPTSTRSFGRPAVTARQAIRQDILTTRARSLILKVKKS